MKRNYGLDFVRLIAFLFVVCVHSLPDNINIVLYKSCQALFYTCNGMFYMLSGYFALSRNEKDIQYGKYFCHKVFTLLLPFAVLSLLLQLMHYLGDFSEIFSVDFLRGYLMALFNTNSVTHLWFMYPLIGMTLSAPFWALMISNFEKKNLKLLIVFSLIWNLISYTLLNNLGYGVAFSGTPLSAWVLLYVLGYCYYKELHENIDIKFMIITGIICFILTVAQVVLLPNHANNVNDLSAVYILLTYIMFHLFNLAGSKLPGQKIISFLAKHTFPAYIFHYWILDKVKYVTGQISNIGIYYVVTVVMVAALSILIGIILDIIIINPIKGLEKFFCKNSNKRLV